MEKKFILNFTPTGMIPTKELTPNVPTQPNEIIEQTLEAAGLGANMIQNYQLLIKMSMLTLLLG